MDVLGVSGGILNLLEELAQGRLSQDLTHKTKRLILGMFVLPSMAPDYAALDPLPTVGCMLP